MIEKKRFLQRVQDGDLFSKAELAAVRIAATTIFIVFVGRELFETIRILLHK